MIHINMAYHTCGFYQTGNQIKSVQVKDKNINLASQKGQKQDRYHIQRLEV